MRLEGSCKCGVVRFSIDSHTPYPYQLCYCSICRKAGTGGFAINLMGVASTLDVTGRDQIRVFQAMIEQDAARFKGPCQRNFCRLCGTMLWVYDDQWPDLVHPFASSIDTALPVPPQRVHLMLGSKAPWVQADIRPGDLSFDGYPTQSIEDWHRTRGLWID